MDFKLLQTMIFRLYCLKNMSTYEKVTFFLVYAFIPIN